MAGPKVSIIKRFHCIINPPWVVEISYSYLWLTHTHLQKFLLVSRLLIYSSQREVGLRRVRSYGKMEADEGKMLWGGGLTVDAGLQFQAQIYKQVPALSDDLHAELYGSGCVSSSKTKVCIAHHRV